jgi:hypothetical protein
MPLSSLASGLDKVALGDAAQVSQMQTERVTRVITVPFIIPCVVKFSCYNADTSCNTLRHKGFCL